MAISTCPSCERKLKTPEDAEGRKLRCPGCSAALVITEDGLAPFKEAVKPSKKRGGIQEDEDPPRRARRRAEPEEDEDEEEERPRRRARKGAGIPLWVWLAGGGALAAGLLILVLVLALGGGNKFDKIKEGMTDKEVTAILGEPTTGDTKILAVWYYPPLKKDDLTNLQKLAKTKEVMTIVFDNGKVKKISRVKADDLKKLMK